MDHCDFTYPEYEDLLRRLVDRGYAWVGYGQRLDGEEVLLRHDVDYSPRKAHRMAEIEAEHGAKATYFVQLTSPWYNLFDPEVRSSLRDIEALGHDIQLHFNTHAYFKNEPPEEELTAQVEREFDTLENAVDSPVSTVSFHNPPGWVESRSFDGFRSTYESRFFEEISYVSDSDQRWRETPPMATGIPDRLQLLTHPVLWGEHPGWVSDRLREERDYVTTRIESMIEEQNRIWGGQRGLGSE